MPPIRFRWLMPATLLTLMSAASAQTQAPAADPLDAQAKVPRLAYEPSLAQYRRMTDETVGSWREANDNVGRIGGWRTYLREARQPDAAASAPSAGKPALTDKPESEMPAGHRGHKMQ